MSYNMTRHISCIEDLYLVSFSSVFGLFLVLYRSALFCIRSLLHMARHISSREDPGSGPTGSGAKILPQTLCCGVRWL